MRSSRLAIVVDAGSNTYTKRIDLGGQVGNTLYDPSGHQIVSAAEGRNALVLIDPLGLKITATIPITGCDGAHGFYVDAPARNAYVSCENNATLFTVALDSHQVSGPQPVGATPDVLAFDPGLKRLYVASESGVVSAFRVGDAGLSEIGQVKLAPTAHTIAVDARTHQLYAPLETVDGKPVLRIYAPVQ